MCGWCGTTFASAQSAGARKAYCSRSCQAFAHVRYPAPRQLDVAQSAYLAGIMDGEGSISMQWKHAGSVRPTLSVHVAVAHLPLLEWIQGATGTGSINPVKRQPTDLGTKQMYSWRLGSYPAVLLLRQLVPYLIEKRERAIAAIDSQPLPESLGSDSAG